MKMIICQEYATDIDENNPNVVLYSINFQARMD